MNTCKRILEAVQMRHEGLAVIPTPHKLKTCAPDLYCTQLRDVKNAWRFFLMNLSFSVSRTVAGVDLTLHEVGMVDFEPYGTFDYQGVVYSFQDDAFARDYEGVSPLPPIQVKDIHLTRAGFVKLATNSKFKDITSAERDSLVDFFRTEGAIRNYYYKTYLASDHVDLFQDDV